MCIVEGCESKAVSKGLCAKHYMRRRRTGDPNVTRKPGAKATEWSNFISSQFGELSPRTRARFKLAMSLLDGQPEKVRQETMQRATRGNGSFNFSKLLDMAIMIYVAKTDV